MMKFKVTKNGQDAWIDPRFIAGVGTIVLAKKDNEVVAGHARITLVSGTMVDVHGQPEEIAKAITQKKYEAEAVTLRAGVGPALAKHAKDLKGE